MAIISSNLSKREPFQKWEVSQIKCHQNILPKDVWQHIIFLLGYKNVSCLALSSKHFYNLVNDPFIQRLLFIRSESVHQIPRNFYIRFFASHEKLLNKNIERNHFIEEEEMHSIRQILGLKGARDLIFFSNLVGQLEIFSPRNRACIYSTERDNSAGTASNPISCYAGSEKMIVIGYADGSCEIRMRNGGANSIFKPPSRPVGLTHIHLKDIVLANNILFQLHLSQTEMVNGYLTVQYALVAFDWAKNKETFLLDNICSLKQCSNTHLLLKLNKSSNEWIFFNTEQHSGTQFSLPDSIDISFDTRAKCFAALQKSNNNQIELAIYSYIDTPFRYELIHKQAIVNVQYIEWRHGCLWLGDCLFGTLYKWDLRERQLKTVIKGECRDFYKFAWVHERILICPSRGQGRILNFAPPLECLKLSIQDYKETQNGSCVELWFNQLLPDNLLKEFFTYCKTPAGLNDPAWRGWDFEKKISLLETFITQNEKTARVQSL